MLILFSISRGLEIWSVNYTSIYENSEFKDFWKYDLFVMKFNWTNGVFLITVANNVTIII